MMPWPMLILGAYTVVLAIYWALYIKPLRDDPGVQFGYDDGPGSEYSGNCYIRRGNGEWENNRVIGFVEPQLVGCVLVWATLGLLWLAAHGTHN